MRLLEVWLRRALKGWMVAALLLATAWVPGANPASAKPMSITELGERLYKQGIGVDGKPVAAIDMSRQRVFAPQFHCVSCHRPSGYGSREGGVFIPPIAAPVLYHPLKPERTRLFNSMYFQQQSNTANGRLYEGRTRPAYDQRTLAHLLRTGIDPAGRPVPDAMPRFVLSDRDIGALDAYLHTLSAQPDPGVDDKSIHLALIVSDRISEQARKTLIATSQAYANRVNSNINSEQSRPNFSPYYRSDFVEFWRPWTVDIWELKGAEDTWPSQLEAYSNAQPAFAVIGADTAAPWQPIGDFCDAKRLPCLFPVTDLPASNAAEGGYTIYSYGGLPLEARSLAAYFGKNGLTGRTIVQIASPDPEGAVPAAAFAAAMKDASQGGGVVSQSVSSQGWSEALNTASQRAGQNGILVLWPGASSAAAIAALAKSQVANELIVVPSASEGDAIKLIGPLPWADRLRIVHPRELPSVVNPHSYRVRAWLYARRVAVDPPEDQFQVYYGLSVFEKALMEIQGDYSREYLIEEIEMIAESNLNPGVYPSLSLGPGQRIASRGSYVVKLDPKATGSIVPDGDWIVP